MCTWAAHWEVLPHGGNTLADAMVQRGVAAVILVYTASPREPKVLLFLLVLLPGRMVLPAPCMEGGSTPGRTCRSVSGRLEVPVASCADVARSLAESHTITICPTTP